MSYAIGITTITAYPLSGKCRDKKQILNAK